MVIARHLDPFRIEAVENGQKLFVTIRDIGFFGGRKQAFAVTLMKSAMGSGRLRLLGCTPVNPPGDGVAWVPTAPVCLRLLSAGSLTLRLAASPLTVSYSRIRPEPPATDRASSAA
jgi:hypothetical protein